MSNTVIIRTNEIILKGGNRTVFLRALLRDVREKLAMYRDIRTVSDQGSIFLEQDKDFLPHEEEDIKKKLQKTFGIAVFHFGTRVKKEENDIIATAKQYVAQKEGTFKVFCKRNDKTFPISSQDLAKNTGAALLFANSTLRVDVHSPEHALYIEIRKKDALVFGEKIAGGGGLPLGVSGTVVALLSGGIDSPVAAWKVMRRGCRVILFHAHSYPFVSRASVEKVERLAEILRAYDPNIKLILVPIGEIQREIVQKANESYRVLLYRRLMLRFAEQIAEKYGALGIVTGESIGQVASQTLENMAAVSAVAKLPIYRPLIGDDKEDIIRIARHIGTYDVSIEPHEDCCSLFLPKKPIIKSEAEELNNQEKKYDGNSFHYRDTDWELK